MTTATETLSETDRVFGKGIAPSTIFTADNLDVLRGMNSECIDLIYLDPPLITDMSRSPFDLEARSLRRSSRDVWTKGGVGNERLMDIRRGLPALDQIINAAAVSHSESMQAYLAYMSIRLVEMRRVLKETGSIYLHCDPTASHYLKAAMDSIFGHRNFLDEVIWNYGGVPRGVLARRKPVQAHDTLLVYVKSRGNHTYNIQRLGYSEKYAYPPRTHNGVSRDKQYMDEARSTPLSNVWSDLQQLNAYHLIKRRKESVGYPTQKPLALLERIIRTSTNPGDVVLDPFCGCATACVAAEGMTSVLDPNVQEKRLWIGIDIDPTAYQIMLQRMEFGARGNEVTVLRKTVRHDPQYAGGNISLPY